MFFVFFCALIVDSYPWIDKKIVNWIIKGDRNVTKNGNFKEFNNILNAQYNHILLYIYF